MKKVLFIILGLQILSLTSCCEEDLLIIGTGPITAFNEDFEGESITNITAPFFMLVALERRLVVEGFQNPFANQLYATSCGENFLNTVNLESILLSTNKDFEYKSNTIVAGMDIMNLDGISARESFGLFIDFKSAFIENADFAEDDYQFMVTFTTSDGETYSGSIDLTMNI